MTGRLAVTVQPVRGRGSDCALHDSGVFAVTWSMWSSWPGRAESAHEQPVTSIVALPRAVAAEYFRRETCCGRRPRG
ncbi:hypothetical protein [Blastococcus deserti]|uniref:Uncharacterized protein n=1 Tax=Blastococcus deserti TaxID=2259033 RepID=A0ABW4XDK3_9ACTN